MACNASLLSKTFWFVLYVFANLSSRCDAAARKQKRYNMDMLRNESVDAENRVIRVAASASLNPGDTFERYGHDMVRGWDMFAQWLNVERGGIQLNNCSYYIVFDFIEDYSDNAMVAKAYKSSLRDVNLFFAPYSSRLTRDAIDITDPGGAFLLATEASNTAMFQNSRTSFTTLPPNLEYLESSLAALAAYGSKTVAVLKDIDFGGCGTAQDSNTTALKYGLSLYKHYDLDPASPYYSSSVSAIIAELNENGVETVMGCTYVGLCYEVDT